MIEMFGELSPNVVVSTRGLRAVIEVLLLMMQNANVTVVAFLGRV